MIKISPSFFNRNKFYVISGSLFFIWLLLFDRSNLYTQFRMVMDLKKLEKENEFYKKELVDLKVEESQILGSLNSVEKFAREKYWMKKEGETVFVLVDKDDKIIVEEKNQ